MFQQRRTHNDERRWVGSIYQNYKDALWPSNWNSENSFSMCCYRNIDNNSLNRKTKRRCCLTRSGGRMEEQIHTYSAVQRTPLYMSLWGAVMFHAMGCWEKVFRGKWSWTSSGDAGSRNRWEDLFNDTFTSYSLNLWSVKSVSFLSIM